MPSLARTAAKAGAAAETLEKDADDVLAALVAAQARDVAVPPGRLGPVTGQNALATCGLPDALCGSRGRKRFWAAFDVLIEESRARIVDYLNDYRHRRLRVLPEVASNAARVEPPRTPTHSAHSQRADASICVDSILARDRRESTHHAGEAPEPSALSRSEVGGI
jgi:hypothetical protein